MSPRSSSARRARPGLSFNGAYWRDFALLVAGYYVAARAGLALEPIGGIAARVWPASGIALAVLLLRGPFLWPAIAVAALLANLSAGVAIPTALGIAAGDTLAPVIGAALVRRYAGAQAPALLESPRGVLVLFGLGALLSTTLSASIGVFSVQVTGAMVVADFGQLWASWWVGRMLGDAVGAPLLLALASHQPSWRKASLIEASLSVAVLCGLSFLVFFSEPSERVTLYPFLLFPPLLWLSLGFRQLGASLATAAIALISTAGTARGLGPFASDDLAGAVLLLNWFLGVVAFSGLVLAAFSSERRRALQQLLVSDRLASMGSLAAGIGHEINNPLAYLSMSLEMIGKMARNPDQLRDPQRLSQLVGMASEGAERVRTIVFNMQALARADAGVGAPVDSVSVVESALQLVSSQIEGRAKLVREFAPVPLVHVSQSRLHHVLVNLLLNAIHAIAPGDPESNAIRVVVRVGDKKRVEIIITDTGSGIESRHLSRIFEPFFTTREVGQGIGLGLSVAHTLVTGFGGSLQVDSKKGQGASFRVLLPATPKPRQRRGRSETRPPGPIDHPAAQDH
jgi:signal transduction histidine kinase